MDFMTDGVMPTDKEDATKIKRLSLRYFVQDGQLYRRGYQDRPLRCIRVEEAKEV